jgi:D-alanyl-D-alanine carboxypeptidase
MGIQHPDVEVAMPIATAKPFVLGGSVGGKGATNKPSDVATVHAKLLAIRESSTREGIPLHGIQYIPWPRKMPGLAALAMQVAGASTHSGANGNSPAEPNGLDDVTLDWIVQFQSLFMRAPDGLVVPGGTTAKFLAGWSVSAIEPGVVWQGRLKEAWLRVSPLLPPQSRCTSAYRSADDQKRIIDRMFLTTYAVELRGRLGARYAAIVALTGDVRYASMVTELRAIGQAVAMPGRSPHQRGKAFDIGGPSDAEQVRVCRMVAAANSMLFSGRVLRERNGCVHVEIV